MAEQLLKDGSKGPAVTELQELLAALEYDPGEVDGIFGPRTQAAVRKLQADAGVAVDGIVGSKTWVAINEADKTEPLIKSGAKGTAVRKAQSKLARAGFDVGEIDGIFGPKLEAAVRVLQEKHGLAVDGIIGPKTWAAISTLAPLPDNGA